METEKKQRIRKEGRQRGTRTQKTVSFRCDLENIEWLSQKPNKGRYINELIAKDRQGLMRLFLYKKTPD